jgi:hypothetical protein
VSNTTVRTLLFGSSWTSRESSTGRCAVVIDNEDANIRSNLAALGPAALRELRDVLTWPQRRLACPASAAERTKRGAATKDRHCFNYPGSSYAHQGCRFTRLRDDSLRLRTVDARATVRYRFFVPRDATIDRIRIAREEPPDTYTCKDESSVWSGLVAGSGSTPFLDVAAILAVRHRPCTRDKASMRSALAVRLPY